MSSHSTVVQIVKDIQLCHIIEYSLATEKNNKLKTRIRVGKYFFSFFDLVYGDSDFIFSFVIITLVSFIIRLKI